MTELRRLERMRQDFVANVSHELKTPLASIKAYTETLLDWALHDENVNVRFLKRIEEQADRLNQLILDLLSLARLESGQEVFEHGPLALAPVVASCVESHRGRAEAKGLDLTLDLGPLDDETLVLADEEAIRQILDNLIDNAIKYTPEGGSVRVACRLDGDAVAVEVADTGIGIPRDDLPARLRAVLPRRQGPEPRAGRDRPGPLDRQAPGPVDRRPDRPSTAGVGAGTRFTVQLPRVTAGRRPRRDPDRPTAIRRIFTESLTNLHVGRYTRVSSGSIRDAIATAQSRADRERVDPARGTMAGSRSRSTIAAKHRMIAGSPRRCVAPGPGRLRRAAAAERPGGAARRPTPATVVVDGSSTVFRISKAAQEAYDKVNPTSPSSSTTTAPAAASASTSRARSTSSTPRGRPSPTRRRRPRRRGSTGPGSSSATTGSPSSSTRRTTSSRR